MVFAMNPFAPRLRNALGSESQDDPGTTRVLNNPLMEPDTELQTKEQRLISLLGEAPSRDQYKPSTGRNIMASIIAGLQGLTSPERGMVMAKNIQDKRYNDANEGYQGKVNSLREDVNMGREQRQRRLSELTATKGIEQKDSELGQGTRRLDLMAQDMANDVNFKNQSLAEQGKDRDLRRYISDADRGIDRQRLGLEGRRVDIEGSRAAAEGQDIISRINARVASTKAADAAQQGEMGFAPLTPGQLQYKAAEALARKDPRYKDENFFSRDEKTGEIVFSPPTDDWFDNYGNESDLYDQFRQDLAGETGDLSDYEKELRRARMGTRRR